MKKILVTGVLLSMLSLPLTGFAQPQDQDHDRDQKTMAHGKEAHPVIRDSIRKLQEVRNELEHKAASDFKGHKAAAIKSIDEAIGHLNEALRTDTK